MPLFKRKKGDEPKPEEKAGKKDTQEKEDAKKKEEVAEEVDDEETDTEDEETDSEEESSEEDETESTEQVAGKDSKKEGKQEIAKKDEVTKKEESESEDESEDESEEDETQKTETETQQVEETTEAHDATLDMSEAQTDFGDTLNTTTGELPKHEEEDVHEEEEEVFEAIDDYNGEVEGDLRIVVGDRLTILHKQDDGWWEAENEHGDHGLVPSTYLKQVKLPQSPTSPKSAKALWGGLKKTINQTSTTDVLHMMGSVPTGFRKEYLKPRFDKRPTSAALLPKLSPSNLFFNDLNYSPAQGRVKSRPSQWCRMILLNEFRNIPLPGKGTKVLKRCVRIGLFDGTEVCSNIIKVDAVCLDREERTWTFNQKESEQMQSCKLGQIFVRTNQKSAHIGVLFELGVLFVRESSGNETEMICGWSLVPLFEEGGNPTPNKNMEVPVNGGTPEDKGLPLDAVVGTNEQSNVFRSLLMRNKAPNFVCRILQPGKEQKDLLELLPDTIIGSAAHINAFSYYRQVLADQLLRDRMDIMSSEPISDPYLATFPLAANDPTFIDLLRNAWIEAQKKMNRQQKKDPTTMKNRYLKCFMDKVYPRLCLTEEDQLNEKKKDGTNPHPVKTPRYTSPLAMLLSPEPEFRPFHTDEIAFSVVNQHCTKAW